MSMDATLRCCVPILGQASYRASPATRAAACFNDAESKRRVLTVRGRTSAVVGLWPIPQEDAPSVYRTVVNGMPVSHRATVKHLVTDNPSPKLLITLRRAFPNLESLSLDPLHLAIVYEYATWRKRTPGSRMLRCILRKFAQFDPAYTSEPWGGVYSGRENRPLSREETLMRQKILDGSMSTTRAKLVEARIESSKPFYTRVDFVESLAALASIHPTEMKRKAICSLSVRGCC